MKVLGPDAYRIVFLGDIVGRPGRQAVLDSLPHIVTEYDPLFIVANGENAAHGTGITPSIAESLFKEGVNAITLGNHAFRRDEICDYLDDDTRIVRPANMPAGVPGRGVAIVERGGVRLAVVNLCGRIYLEGYGDPFAELDRLLAGLDTPHVFLDFHAEATSEKVAMGYHADGRTTCVVGTHTHVQTADERVLAGGTAYITDAGMCGPESGVIGVAREAVLRRFRLSLPARFEVARGPGVICGVAIDVKRETGRAIAIERIRLAP